MSEIGPPRPEDERLLRLALAIGRRGLGRTWPNPSVGAVLARPEEGGARIVALGATEPGGRPHAERVAIAAAGAEARGCTLYCSLEPCRHFGRTPPCVEAIVRAGIARVVSAVDDPHPDVAGRAAAFLRGAGLDVRSNALAAEGRRAHLGHMTRARLGRPAMTLKLACTADGFAAAGPGEARLMISGPAAGARVHAMRAEADAILVGVGTVLADDPRLDVRLPGLEGRSPLRIVLDRRLRIPVASSLVRTARLRPLWLLCGPEAERGAEAALADLGAVVVRVPATEAGLDLGQALAELGRRGLTHVLCEGGPTLAEALAAADLIDQVCLVTSDRALGRPGVPAVGRRLADTLFSRLRVAFAERLGPDTLATYERG